MAYTDANGCDGVPSAELEITVESCSDITITKTVNESNPNIGENVIFTITVTNTGDTVFTDVLVSEALPDGYRLVSITSNNGSYDEETGVWTIAELLPGESAIMQVEVQVLFGGDYTNIAFILTSTPADSNRENNTAEVSTEPTCLIVYNEFTPNGDGLNDTFRIDCIEFYPDNTLEVFNRFGNKVFSTRSYKNDWDGTANVDGVVRRNEKLPVGTYFYTLEVDGQVKTGWLYIMR